MRLCVSNGVDIEMKFKDGKLSDNGFASQSNYISANIALQISNSTEITFVRFLAECVNRFATNQSDFSMGSYDFIQQKQPYYVPCPSLPSSLYFISGYEVNEYQISRNVHSFRAKWGVLNNVGNFAPSVYTLLSIWLVINLLLVIVKVALRVKNPQKHMLQLVQVSLKLAKRIFRGKSLMNRIFCFFLNLGFFFISAPFLLLFKTNQVVTPKQPLLTNYEEVIAKNAQVIYSNIQFDETILLRPLQLDDQSRDIQDRFWRHFNSNSQKVTFGTSLEDRSVIDLMVKSIVQQKSIYLASFEVAHPLMQTFCSWSEHPDLYRMFVLKDVNQRETLTGFALRRGFESKKLVKRIRNAMEFYIYQHIPFASSNYADVPWKLDPVVSHKQLQVTYCQQSERSGQNKRQTLKASDIEFFDYFLRGLTVFISFAFFLLSVEMQLMRKKRKKIHQKPTRVGG